MKRAFISYASEDADTAKEIYKYLDQRGIKVWIDSENLIPGQNWEVEIEKEINNTKYFIACLSNNSVSKRGYVQKELKTALKTVETIPEDEIFIIPIMLDDCEMPHSLRSIHRIRWGVPSDLPKLLIAVGTKDIPFLKNMIEADEYLEKNGIIKLFHKLSPEAQFVFIFWYDCTYRDIGTFGGTRRLETHVKYLDGNGKIKEKRLNNFDDFDELWKKYGLGSDDRYIRKHFLEAAKSLSEKKRMKLFGGVEVLSLEGVGSPK